MPRADSELLRLHSLDRSSTWEQAMEPFNIGAIRAADLPSDPQNVMELTWEYLDKQMTGLARLLDERAEARHQEILALLRSR